MIKSLYNTITNKYVIITWILVLILYLINKYCLPKILGWFGEHWAKCELKKLPKDKYKIINNLFININNTTHQIDHVVVSIYGIFVIETKQYNGYITGSKYDYKWIRHTRGKKYEYTNPIRQNYGHVKSIAELLNIDEGNLYNLVYIPSKHVKLNIKHDGELLRPGYLYKTIIETTEEKLPNYEEIYNKLLSYNITDKNAVKAHITNIREEHKSDSNRCPKCGGELVLRQGKYGSFYGCSNYPKCKYTK